MYPRSYTTNWLTKTKPILVVFLVVANIFSSVTIPAFFDAVPRVEAAFNAQINYQGKLTNASNVAVADGVYHMKFWLLTSPTAATTTAIWTEDRSTVAGNRVTVSNGLFSVMLGSSTPLTTVDFNQTLYLGVEVGGSGGSPSWDGEMSPRKVLGAVPAAFEADRLDGLSSTEFFRTDATNATSSATTSLSVVQNGAGKIAEFFGPGASSVFSILSTGNVGVGTTSPYSKFSVSGQAAASNYVATLTSATSSFAGSLTIGDSVGSDILLANLVKADFVLSNSGFTTGFYLNNPLIDAGVYISSNYGNKLIVTDVNDTGMFLVSGENDGSSIIKLGDVDNNDNGFLFTIDQGNEVFKFEGSGPTLTFLDTIESASWNVTNAGDLLSMGYDGYGFLETGTGGATYLQGAPSQDVVLSPNSGGSIYNYFKASGRVGFSTSTPGTSLGIGNTGSNTINLDINATSTFGYGINLRNGCFAVNGTCLTSSSGTVGSGTTGQFPYYAGSGTTLTATSSLFLATSGNVGVGSTTPSAKLSVNVSGSGDATGLYTRVSAGGDNASKIAGRFYGTGSGTGDFIYGVYSEAYGTGDPNAVYALYGVAGASNGTGAYGSGFIGVEGVSNFASGYALRATQSNSSGYAVYSSGGKNYFQNNVGIGTTSPYAMLSVAGETVARNFTATTTTATSTFAGGFSAASSFYVLQNGNVGIGTAAPASQLQVTGTGIGSFGGNTGVGITLTSTGSTGRIVVPTNASSPSTIDFITDTTNLRGLRVTTGYSIIGTNDSFFQAFPGAFGYGIFEGFGGAGTAVSSENSSKPILFTPGRVEAARFSGGGSFGIGTTTPGTKFAIGNTGASTINIDATATSTFGFGINLRNGCFAVSGTCVGGSNLTGSGAANRAAFWTGSGSLSYSDGFVWDNTNGRLGIGTTSPYATLSVAGQVVAQNYVATSTTATSTFAYDISTTGRLSVLQSGTNATIIGNTAGNARGSGAVEIQSGRTFAYQVASGVNSIVVGRANQSDGSSSMTFGLDNTNSGNTTLLLGVGNTAASISSQSLAVGYSSAVSGAQSSAVGYTNSVESDQAGAFGTDNTVKTAKSYAVGYSNFVEAADYQYAFGFDNYVDGSAAMVIGYSLSNSIDDSIQIGRNSAKITVAVDPNDANTVVTGFNNESPLYPIDAIGRADAGTVPSAAANFQNTGSIGSGLSAKIAIDDTITGNITGSYINFYSDTGGLGHDFYGNGNSYFQGATVGALAASNLTVNGNILTGVGSVSTPAYSFALDPNTGMYRTGVADNLAFATGGVQRMLLDANGNVGISSSTPWGRLSVSSVTQQSGLTPLFVVASTTNATLFNILGNGNVGIGTTSPFNLFSVIGGTDQATAYFYNNGGSGKTRVTIRAGAGNSNSGITDPVLSIQNSAGTQTAVIRGDGLIGSTFLGTTDDVSAFLVDSTVATADYPRGLNMGSLSVVGWGSNQWWTTKDVGLSRGAAGKLYVGNGTQGNSSGTLIANSIGVATTSPATAFSVAGNGYLTGGLGVGVVNSTAGTLNVRATGSGGNPVAQLIVPNKSSASRMLSFYEATSGADWNIWMGTETIPYFYIGGNGATSQYFWRANWNDTAAPANTFKSASDGANQVVVGIQGASAQSADYVQVTTSGSTAGNIFKINSSGNVGIGTTSPYAKLSVNGRGVFNQDVRADYFTATSTTATSTFAGFIDVNGTGTNATSTFASNLWVKGALRIGTSSLYLDTNGISSTDGTLKLRAGTTATSTFPLLSVGTTTATTTAKLMVDGAFNLNSSNGALVIGDTLGNARGARSIDIQSRRASATQVSSGLDSIALGSLNTASGQYSNAIGYGNAATAASVALGWGNGAYGFASTAIGYGNSSNADAVTAIGYNNSGQAYGNTLYGENNTIPSGERNIAIGHANTVDTVNGFSAAFGFSNSIVSAVSGTDHSFAVGYGNAIVSNSVGGNSAFGNNIIVDYNNSTEDTIVFGKDFTASNITDGVVLANATNQLILVDGSGWYASGITESAGTGSLCFDSGTAKILLNDFSDDCTSSTRVTKHNIQDLNVNGLEMIQELNPVSFIYNNGNGRTKYGFIAEDSVAVDERFGSFNSMGSLTGIDDTAIISITVKSIQEVASRISLNAAPTSTPSIVINSIGNVGFGIEDADYKIEAAGDVSGYGFAIKSDRSAVSNVEEVDQETIESYAEKIRDIELSTYSYEGDTSTSTRLGILSNDAPSEILTAQGDVDMYKLAVFTLGAVQAQQLRLEDIEARLEAVEAAVLVDGGSLLGNPFQIFEDAGITITETLAQFKNVLVAGLIVGSEEKPTGITLYDTETGSPYCVKVKNGKLKSFLGACEEASDVEVPDDKEPTLPADDNTPTDTSTPTTPDDTNETPHEPTVPADETPAEPTIPDTDSNPDVATPDAPTEVSSADTDSSDSNDSGSDSDADAGGSSSGGETSSAGGDSGPQS